MALELNQVSAVRGTSALDVQALVAAVHRPNFIEVAENFLESKPLVGSVVALELNQVSAVRGTPALDVQALVRAMLRIEVVLEARVDRIGGRGQDETGGGGQSERGDATAMQQRQAWSPPVWVRGDQASLASGPRRLRRRGTCITAGSAICSCA
jgi:hypothetical protein